MDKAIKQAEHALNIFELKESTEMFRDAIPEIVKVSRMIYDECIKQGYSEQQAFTFSKEYVFKLVFNSK
jgi:hypothetical protein